MLIKIHKENKNNTYLSRSRLFSKRQKSKMKITTHGLKMMKKSKRK